MQYAIYGALGAILALFLFGGGIYLGFKIKPGERIWGSHRASQELSPEEKQKRLDMMADHKAFIDMCNYSSECAYGIEPKEGDA